MIRGGNAEGNGGVSNDAEDGGGSRSGILKFRDGIDVKHGSDKSVCCPISAGEHDRAAYFLPVGVEGKLLVEERRVGHDLVLPAVVDNQFAVLVFKDGTIAGSVGQGKMDIGLPVGIRELVGNDDEWVFGEIGDGFGNGGKVVENELGLGRDRYGGGAPVVLRKGGLIEPENVGDQSCFIDSISGGDVEP